MKKVLFLFVLCQLLAYSSIHANHVFGADLTYRCINNFGQYELTYTFYRNCNGANAPQNVPIDVNNVCGFPVQTVTLVPLNPIPEIISADCPGHLTMCNGGSELGIEKYVYTGIVTIPAECEQWIFSYTRYSRSSFIFTLETPYNYGLYVEATMNNSNGIQNSSPVFLNLPQLKAIIDQPISINPSISEPDGDLIECFLINPLGGYNIPIPFSSGYSVTNPISSSAPIVIDNLNGILSMTPDIIQCGVIAIKVIETRNGIVVGEVERDVQLNISNYSNHTPSLTGINGNGTYDLTVCAGEPAGFHIYSYETDVFDSTKITWDQSIANCSFTTSGGVIDTAYFLWQTTTSDISSTPYCFTATVTDNNCISPYFQDYTYCITVESPGLHCAILSTDNNFDGSSPVKIYPQPASENFFIDFGNETTSKNNFQLCIKNVLGETVYQSTVEEQIISVNSNQWAINGFYIAYLLDENGKIVRGSKLVINR